MSTEFYEELLAKHGDSPKSLDWSEDGQKSRFKVLKEVGIGDEHTVVDVGCGLGHFADYLFDEGVDIEKYIGLDKSPKMIEAAIKMERDIGDATFLVRDALKDSIPEGDFVVSSGLLNVLPEHSFWGVHVKALITNCFKSARIGCAVNMLSMYAMKKRQDRYYVFPDHVVDWAFKMTPYITLRHDYRENDFTIYLYKGPRP